MAQEEQLVTPWPVYLQINVSGEEAKQGLAPAEAARFAESVVDSPAFEVCGLMTMAPRAAGDAATRRVFEGLRTLSERLRQEGALPSTADGLSMGMSEDFEIAVEEGATIVRVGSRLFVGSQTE